MIVKKAVMLFILTFSVFFNSLYTFPSSTAAAASEEGRSFSAGQLHKIKEPFHAPVRTLETWIYFPADTPSASRGGVILGSYDDYGGSISIEIYSNGNPRVYKKTEGGNVYSWIFRKVSLYTGKWEHLALVHDDEAGEIRCYLNGELQQTLTAAAGEPLESKRACVIGGDYRPYNAMYFTGRMKSLSVYSDVRTQEELFSDMKTEKVDLNDKNLMAAYVFSKENSDANEQDILQDISGNHYDAAFYPMWLKKKDPVTDYAYSFAVVGDTQIMNCYYPEQFPDIYDWIAANAESKNIKFVFGLGDVTDRNTPEEWERAAEQVAKLDGVVPYSLVRGNHDGHDRFENAFPYAKYKDVLGGSYSGSMLNTWQTITVGKIQYLILSLDYGASDAVLAWADEVINAHEECNVIVTTHAYLYRDGTTLDVHDVCPPSLTGGYNNGDDIWKKFVSQHENIVLVLSGHDISDEIVMTQSKGVNGNTVTQMMINPQNLDAAQGGSGMVAMLYFSADGRKVSVEYYSTVRGMYFLAENQFDFTMDVYTPVPTEITSPVYSIEAGTIRNVAKGTTVSELLSGINEVSFCKVYMNGKEIDGSSLVGTGAEIRILKGTKINASLTVSVSGDINGDGKVTVTDLLMLTAGMIENKLPASKAAEYAADTNNDMKLSLTDFLQMKAMILENGSGL